MFYVRHTHVAELVRAAAGRLLKSPPRASRGGVVRGVSPATLALDGGAAAYLCDLPARRLDPWASLREFPWLLAGRNDVAFLEPTLPGAAKWADDGVTWRAGYGPRLRRPEEPLLAAVRELRLEPFSRRAAVTLFEAGEDVRALNAGTVDFPCTMGMVFRREETWKAGVQLRQLELDVFMRSNDLLWGYSGVNVVNWSLLLLLVSEILGLPAGRYNHITSSLHAYDETAPDVRLRRLELEPSPYLADRFPLEAEAERSNFLVPGFRPDGEAVEALASFFHLCALACRELEDFELEVRAALERGEEVSPALCAREEVPDGLAAASPWLSRWLRFQRLALLARRGVGTPSAWVKALLELEPLGPSPWTFLGAMRLARKGADWTGLADAAGFLAGMEETMWRRYLEREDG